MKDISRCTQKACAGGPLGSFHLLLQKAWVGLPGRNLQIPKAENPILSTRTLGFGGLTEVREGAAAGDKGLNHLKKTV